MRKLRTLSLRIKEAQISHIQTHTYTHTHKKIIKKNNNKIATNLTTGYTLWDVNTEDTIRHNIKEKYIKENTKQSNANPILQCLWRLIEMLQLNLCIQKKIMKEKPGKNITQSAVIKDRNYGED